MSLDSYLISGTVTSGHRTQPQLLCKVPALKLRIQFTAKLPIPWITALQPEIIEMAFAVPIMKNNFNIYLLEEKPIRSRNMSACSANLPLSFSEGCRGSRYSLVSTTSSTRSTNSNEILYKSRWDLTNPFSRLGKFGA